MKKLQFVKIKYQHGHTNILPVYARATYGFDTPMPIVREAHEITVAKHILSILKVTPP